jgi:methionine aminopeptidase
VQTFFVGNVDEDGRRLVKCAFDCLSAAVAMVRPDTMYRDVGNTITKVRPFPPITNEMTSLRGHRCTCGFFFDSPVYMLKGSMCEKPGVRHH